MNPQMNTQMKAELEDGAREIIGVVNTGVVLGVRNKNKITICNTYLSNDMLKHDQALVTKSLKSELDDYIALIKTGVI